MSKAIVEKFITEDGTVMASSVICTDLIEECREIHDTFPVATAALGRSIIGVGLLATFMKDAGRLALYFKGDGPLGSIFAEGSSEGHVRGYITNPHVHVPSRGGNLNVGGGVGKGILSVATTLPNEKRSYTGKVDIQSGEIGEDIAYYLFQSQQTPSIVALGVFVEPDNTVSAAGGTIVQVLPGVTDKTLETLETRVKKMRSITDLIRGGASTGGLAKEALEDFKFKKINETIALTYQCHCSMKRVERSLLLLGASELQILVAKTEPAEVQCDFCGRKYSVDVETLQGLLGLTKRSTTH